jgi:TolB protein
VNQALFVINVDGSGLRRITPWGFSDDDGGWSPDGTKILFGTRSALYVVHPDGSHLTKIRLATGGHANAFDAGWSPDGTKIVFSLGVGSGPSDIYTANTDGTDLQQVTNDSSREEKADWGPHPSILGTDG